MFGAIVQEASRGSERHDQYYQGGVKSVWKGHRESTGCPERSPQQPEQHQKRYC